MKQQTGITAVSAGCLQRVEYRIPSAMGNVRKDSPRKVTFELRPEGWYKLLGKEAGAWGWW